MREVRGAHCTYRGGVSGARRGGGCVSVLPPLSDCVTSNWGHHAPPSNTCSDLLTRKPRGKYLTDRLTDQIISLEDLNIMIQSHIR